MRRPKLPRTLAAAAIAAALLVSGVPATLAEGTTTLKGTALSLLGKLATAAEHPAGYRRSAFVLWIDADHDGCDTRHEVLIAESTTRVRIGSGCSIKGGTWRSAYDGRTTRAAPTLDIDHVVPLKEAWDSGAWRWTATRRKAYANDLGDTRALRAVSAASNRAKGDRDPADWLPPSRSFRCKYATDWVAVKVRWGLKVNSAERSALKRVLGACPIRTVSVRLAT